MIAAPLPSAVPKAEVARRLEHARQLVVQRGFDALLVIGRAFYERPGDLAYLTNHFPPFPTAVFANVAQGLGHSVLVLPVEAPPVLYIDHPSYWSELVAVDDVRPGSNVFGGAITMLRGMLPTGGYVGVAPAELLPWPVAEQIYETCPSVRLESAGDLVASMRRRKSPTELELLRRAAGIAATGLQAAVEAIAPGVTEADVSGRGTGAAIAAGADFVRYFRVHSGPFASWGSRWPPATSRHLQAGDLVAMDVIGAVGGYQFDVNRTAACGAISSEQRRLCEAVYDATARCVEAATAGTTVARLVEVATTSFEQAGYGSNFSGSLGHGIGLETVELPYLRRGVEATLVPDEVLCLEPGLFIHDTGGCSIEQIVVVREHHQPELLTTFPARLW